MATVRRPFGANRCSAESVIRPVVPDRAMVFYKLFCDALAALDVPVERDRFRHKMNVRSVYSGSICLLLDSRRDF